MGLKYNPLTFASLQFSGGGSSFSIGVPIGGADNNSVLIVDSLGKLADVPLINGQLLIGRTGNTPVAASITGTSNQVIVTPGSGSITLSLPQSIATTSSPTFANLNLSPSGALDITGAGTLAIGTGNADIINIGNSGATINIQGDTFYQNVTDLNVTDKNITVNHGGSAGSASNAGIQVEENGSITAYVDTTADRSGWEFKAPSTAGIVTITPGTSGFTIDQGSHNPVTIGTANGLSLSTQVLSLALSSTSTTGALSSSDWNTFNGKQTAGNYLTALTGDGTASGPGSATFTLATVNSNVGSFNTLTVNAKGLVTAASNTSYEVPLTFSTGLTRTVNTITVNTSQNINTLSNLTTNGFVKTSGGTGALSVDTNSYVVTVPADIIPTTFSGLVNNTANQTITGFTFATSVSSFDALVNVFIDATTDTYTTFKITGTRNAADWTGADLQVQYSGASVSGLSFSVTAAGQVQVTTPSISGFTSGTIKFRAQTV